MADPHYPLDRPVPFMAGAEMMREDGARVTVVDVFPFSEPDDVGFPAQLAVVRGEDGDEYFAAAAWLSPAPENKQETEET